MTEVQVIAHYRMTAGREDEVLALLPELARAARTEPGNINFLIFRGVESPQEIVLLERYTSRAALAAHREMPHFTELVLKRIVPLLDSRVVEVFDATD